MSHRRVLQSHKENRWITASSEVCIYSPVVYLKEALSQKESIILKNLQIRRIQSLIYFFEPPGKRHQGCKGWLCAQGCRTEFQAERVSKSERNVDYLTDNRGDTDVWPWNHVQKAQTAERAEQSLWVLQWVSVLLQNRVIDRKEHFYMQNYSLLFFLKDSMKICATAWNLPASILLLSDSTAGSVLCFSLQ